MPRVEIVGYGLVWNPTSQTGQVTVKYKHGQTVPIPVKSAADLTAMAMILNESPVYLDTDSGFFMTGLEAVGGT